MEYIVLAVIVGIATGLLSLKFEKTFVAFFFALPACFAFAVKMFTPFANVAAQSGAEGTGSIFAVAGYFYGQLPEPAQTALIIFPVATILARLIGWIYLKSKGPAEEETAADRKKRILKAYGYENGLPY